MTSLHTLLREQRGRYVWGVRAGDESLLSWQVGDPHLHLEPGRTPEGFERRWAELRGRWQVAVLDGRARLGGPLGDLELTAEGEDHEDADEHLEFLAGQALVDFDLEPTRLVLRFDLGCELEISGEYALVRASAGDDRVAEWAAGSGAPR